MSDDLIGLALREILGSSELKSKLFSALEAAARNTETEIDDDIVEAFKAVYDIVIPVIVGHVTKR